MDVLVHHFPVSGVETSLVLPPLVMFVISSLTSMGGLSGAFVLLPFQMSVLGYTAPGVSATNFVYNVVATPSGVYRHLRERRLAWPLLALMMAGTLPGVFVGYYVRVTVLPDPKHFQVFAGLVLAYLGLRTFRMALMGLRATVPKPGGNSHVSIGPITGSTLTLRRATIDFQGETYTFGTAPVLFLALVVGVVGGVYGIGGGAVMAPFCISVLNLPVYVVSGAALFSTWGASVAAALCYAVMSAGGETNASPDWLLGGLFGLGGLAGIYTGSRLQRYVPTTLIKLILAVALLSIAARYVLPALTSAWR